MGVVVIVLLAGLWASILLPSALRSRRNTSPLDSISAFEHSMSMLAPLRPPAAPGREVLVLDRPSTVTGRPGSALVLARRRANLARLAALLAVAVAAAAAFGGMFVWVAVAAGAGLVGYVAVLRSKAARAAEARTKIRRLQVPPGRHEADRAAPAASAAAPDVMADLSAVQAAVVSRLEATHRAREAALPASRVAVRCSANAIRAAHRGERQAARDLLDEAWSALGEARLACAGEPRVEHAGFLTDAEKEFAEAATTLALTGDEPLPGPDELDVGDAAWLNGLAETVGELRRHLLDELRAGRLARSEALLSAMDDIYALLVTIDFPDGVTAGLRRSTDVARSILERTRGDLTTALVQARLRDALESHRRDLAAGA